MEENKGRGLYGYGLVIIAVTAAAQFAATFPQFQLPPIQNLIISQLGLSQSQYVQAYTAPMLPAVLLSLTAGLLVDRFGPKPVIGAALVLSTLGTALRLFAGSYWPFLLAMALTGVAPACIHANSAKIMGQWFPKEKLGLAMGVMMLGGQLSNFTATATTALFSGVSAVYVFSLCLCAGSIAVWFLFAKNRNPRQEAQKKADDQSVLQMLRVVIRSGKLWTMGLCLLFTMGFFMTVASSAPSALQSLGYSPKLASLMAAALSVGSTAGQLLGSALAVRSGNPRRFMKLVMALAAAVVPFAWRGGSPVFSVTALLLTGFAYGTCQITIMSMPTNLPEIGYRYAGTAGGLLAMVQMLGAIIIPSRILVPLAGGSYVLLFFLAAGSLLISLALVFALPDIRATADR